MTDPVSVTIYLAIHNVITHLANTPTTNQVYKYPKRKTKYTYRLVIKPSWSP